MKKITSLLIVVFVCFSGTAQKKVTPETRSALLQIDIPGDAKADKRFLSKLAVGTLIGMKTQPLGLTLKSWEYFLWKDTKIKDTRGATIIDSLLKGLTAASWTMAFDEKDDTVVWLLKENKPLIMMYITAKNEIDLYVGELDKAPPLTFQ